MNEAATLARKGAPATDGPVLLDYDEVAAMLRVSPRTLRRQVNCGKFPEPFMVGRSPRWMRARVIEHIVEAQTDAENGKKKPRC